MRALAIAILLDAACGGVEVTAPEALPVATPDVVEFTTVPAGHGSVAYVDLANEGQALLVIHGVAAEAGMAPCFRLPDERGLSLPPGAGVRLPIGFLPSQPGQFAGRMTLQTNSISRPTVTVALKATASP